MFFGKNSILKNFTSVVYEWGFCFRLCNSDYTVQEPMDSLSATNKSKAG